MSVESRVKALAQAVAEDVKVIFSTLSSKLDASSYTAADVLTKIKTVDGIGSGLDADLLDGQSGSYYQNAGNLNAGTIPAARVPTLNQSTTGNAATATKLATARSIALSGDVTGSVAFDGTANVTVSTSFKNSGVTAGTYSKVTVDAKGNVTAGSALLASDVPLLNQSTSGNAATATKLAVSRTINSVGFDGSADITIADATKLPLTGGVLTGDLVVGSTIRAADTSIRALAADGYSAGFEAHGGSQGTGYLYVGQASDHGGGVVYNGDGTPAFAAGETPDTIAFYRKSANVNTVVFSYPHNSDTVTFRGTIVGNGSGLSSLNAANLASGVIPDARLSGTYSGVNITGNAGSADTIRKIFQTSNTGGSLGNQFTKFLTVTIPTQYSDYDANLRLISFANGSGSTKNSDVYIRVKQQSAFGSNPMVDVDHVCEADDFAKIGYVITSNSGPTTVDFYIQNTAGWNVVAGFLFYNTASGGSGNYLSNQGYVVSVPSLVLVDTVRRYSDTYKPLADRLTTARTISLSGDATGSVVFDGSSNVTIPVVVADDSHNHIIGNIDGLQTTLDSKLASSSYTAADVLAKVVTVDGAGSGLDADLLDGQEGSYYLSATNLNAGTLPDARLAGTYTGVSITGNANTATALQNARTIGGVSFNGTANINLPGVNAAGNQSTTGNAATATKLLTARTINGVSFNGTANITVADATKQTLNTNLTALSGLSGVADRVPYFTGAGALSLATLTAFGRTLTSTTDAAAARTALGVSAAGSSAATGGGSDSVFYENGQTITQNYTVGPSKNAGTFGPVTISSGVTVTISDGCTWSVV